MKRLVIVSALFASMALTAGPAFAAMSKNYNLTVQATVVDNCSVVANTLNFGTYKNGQVANLDGSTTIDVTCLATQGYSLDAGQGAYYNAPDGYRQMATGLERLKYNLFTDSNRTAVWGSTVTNGAAINGLTASGGVDATTIYGRVPGSQYPAAGSYSDTVIITITW